MPTSIPVNWRNTYHDCLVCILRRSIEKGKEIVTRCFVFFLFLPVVVVSVLFLWVTQVCVYLQSISGLVIMQFSVKRCDFWIRVRRRALEMSMLVFMKYQGEKLHHFYQYFVLWPSCSLKYSPTLKGLRKYPSSLPKISVW